MVGSFEGSGPGQAAARSVGYIRVYTDADNVTRFADLDYSAVPVDFAPPAPPVFVTAALAAGSVMLLSGEAIGTAGAEERRVGAGAIILMEDTAGPGHGLTALTDLVMAVVRLG